MILIDAMAKQEKKKPTRLLQTRVNFDLGKKMEQLARAEGISTAAYFRRLIMRHMRDLGLEATPKSE